MQLELVTFGIYFNLPSFGKSSSCVILELGEECAEIETMTRRRPHCKHMYAEHLDIALPLNISQLSKKSRDDMTINSPRVLISKSESAKRQENLRSEILLLSLSRSPCSYHEC